MAKIKFIASMLMFGTIALFVHYIDMPSSVIAMVRGFIGTFFLLISCLITKHRISFRAIGRNLPLLFFSGAMMGANWIFLFEAYKYTNVATATLCYYMAPIIVVAASPLVLREKMTLKKAICSVIALVGMVLVSGVLSEGFTGLTGVVLGLCAAVLYAGVMLVNKRMDGISSYDRTVVQLGTSFIVLLPYCLITVDMSSVHLDARSVIMLLAVGIVHTGICYRLYFGSMAQMSSQSVAIFSYIDPITAVILSAAIPFLGGSFDVYFIIGALLILGASLITELNPRRKALD